VILGVLKDGPLHGYAEVLSKGVDRLPEGRLGVSGGIET
jgi:hypothetical protein